MISHLPKGYSKWLKTLQPGNALSELAVPILKFLWEEETGPGIMLLSTNAKHTFQGQRIGVLFAAFF